MNYPLEKTIAFHCAPALAGLKPANLISCDLKQHPKLEEEICALNRSLNGKGLHFRIVCRMEGRVLMLVYRVQVLGKHLEDTQVLAFLKKAGYADGDLEAMILQLQKRLSASHEFPHETGVFLGYPVEDVEGFLRDGGKNCRLSGYWKVYVNEEQTRALFEKFTQCRKTLCLLVSNGISIVQLFQAA